MGMINKMIDEWNAAGTPLEARLAEALAKLERCHAERLELQHRIHCQRLSLRQNWQIAESRQKWLGSDIARRSYIQALKRNRELQARLDLHLSGRSTHNGGV